MKKIFRVCIALLLCFSLVTPAFALDGIWHNPYGIDDLYDHEPTEIYPLTPIAGEMIYIKSTTWPVEAGQSVWLTYTKNGEPQPDIGAEWKYNSGNNSYWEAAIGPFEKGDVIEYTVFADKDGQNTQSIGPFSFHVVEWERAQSVELGSQEDGLVVLNVTSDQGDSTPKLGLSFPSADVLRFQFSPLGDVAFEAGAADYSIEEDSNSIIISTSALEVTVTKSPYGVEVRDLDTGKLLTQNGGTGSELSWLTDGAGFVKNFRGRYESPSSEKFYGFGERYNGIEKRGETVDIYVYNQYQNQGERSYLAVPFFYSSKGYGLYLDSTYYAQFDMADSDPNQYTFTVNTSGDDPVLDYYIISGTPEEVIGGYSELSGKPQDMPKWAFGLWMSANEWDRQSEVLSAVENAEAYDIPASVVVLEQWSDENTFYNTLGFHILLQLRGGRRGEVIRIPGEFPVIIIAITFPVVIKSIAINRNILGPVQLYHFIELVFVDIPLKVGESQRPLWHHGRCPCDFGEAGHNLLRLSQHDEIFYVFFLVAAALRRRSPIIEFHLAVGGVCISSMTAPIRRSRAERRFPAVTLPTARNGLIPPLWWIPSMTMG